MGNFVGSDLRVEVLDETGEPLKDFTSANSVAFTGDATRKLMTWVSAEDLGDFAGRVLRFRFKFGGQLPSLLYSFWVSSSKCGESHGFNGGGGEGFVGGQDLLGECDSTEPSAYFT